MSADIATSAVLDAIDGIDDPAILKETIALLAIENVELRRKAARRSKGYGREEPEAPTLPAKAKRPAITLSTEEVTPS